MGLAWVAAVVSAGSAAAHTPHVASAAEPCTAVPSPPPEVECSDAGSPDRPMPWAPVPHDHVEAESVTDAGSSSADAAAPRPLRGSSGDEPATPQDASAPVAEPSPVTTPSETPELGTPPVATP